jgi:hypothetical protein
LSFEDSTVLIHELREVELVSNLDRILNTLASHYKNLTLRSGEEPSFISIPVVEDPAGDRLSRFREFLDVDETVQDITTRRYLGFWGLQYDFANTSRVYDVEKEVLLDIPFLHSIRVLEGMGRTLERTESLTSPVCGFKSVAQLRADFRMCPPRSNRQIRP